MNLEKLISKYLDGELSYQEDIELREILANDPEAKATFEEYVEMDYILKKDAQDTSLPKDLKDSVEDQVLMRIMSQTPYDSNPDYIEDEEKSRKGLVLFLKPFV
jgi:anti-sigma factor RsiW